MGRHESASDLADKIEAATGHLRAALIDGNETADIRAELAVLQDRAAEAALERVKVENALLEQEAAKIEAAARDIANSSQARFAALLAALRPPSMPVPHGH